MLIGIGIICAWSLIGALVYATFKPKSAYKRKVLKIACGPAVWGWTFGENN